MCHIWLLEAAPKMVKCFKELDAWQLRNRALGLPRDTDETSEKNLLRIMEESFLALQDEFALPKERRKKAMQYSGRREYTGL